MSAEDLDPQYDPRAWETYRRDAGCGCTDPTPVKCKVAHGTGAWLCVCHRLAGPTDQDTVPGRPLVPIRKLYVEPNRCLSTDRLFRCERPLEHPGDHRMGRTYWRPRADETTPREDRLMPITTRTEPSYAVDCDRCGIPAEHDDGAPVLFATETEARAWARDNGWQVGDELLCTEDAAEAANEQEHNEEIAAAIQYAMGDRP